MKQSSAEVKGEAAMFQTARWNLKGEDQGFQLKSFPFFEI